METSTIEALLERARTGDRTAVGLLLEGQRSALERMLTLRIDGRLRARVDPLDIIQDSFLEASSRLAEYLANPTMPFRLWVRFIATQRLHAIYREHLGAQKRDVRREVPIDGGDYRAWATSEALAAQLVGAFSTPSETVARSELRARLRETLESLDAIDREVIALRHFEQLGNQEIAQILALDESAASKRYLRAMRRLSDRLARIPGMADYPWK